MKKKHIRKTLEALRKECDSHMYCENCPLYYADLSVKAISILKRGDGCMLTNVPTSWKDKTIKKLSNYISKRSEK